MISKNDILLILGELKDLGIDTATYTKSVVSSQTVPIEVVKFINDSRQLDLTGFYKKLRKSYNNGNSKLYKNLMSEDLYENPSEALITLNSYALQVMIYGKSAQDKQMFFRFARLNELYKCLYHYSDTYDLTPCIKLLQLIKSDIKVLESCFR